MHPIYEKVVNFLHAIRMMPSGIPHQPILDFLKMENAVDLEERRKRRVYFVFLALSIPTFLSFGLLHWVMGNYQFVLMNLSIGLVLFGSFFVLRKLHRGLYLYRITCFVYGLASLYWVFQGSMDGNSSIWLLCFPLLAFSFLEKNEGLVWTSLVYLACILIFAAPTNLLQTYIYSSSFKLRFSGVYILITFFSYNYESVRIEFWKSSQNKQKNLEKEIQEKKIAEIALLKAQLNLESRIEARTIELLNTNKALKQEILERITIEDQLRASEERFRDLADLLPQSIFELDNHGKFIYANKFGLKFSGYTQSDMERGVFAADLFVEDDSSKIKDNIKRIVNSQTPLGNEYVMRKKSGETCSVLIYSKRIIKDGKTAGLRGISIDIADRKSFELELMQAKEAAEQASIAKNNFLANMSHELRTPMNGVLGITELMLHTTLTDQQTKYLNTISQSGNVLLKILNDILDLSRIEANKFMIELVHFDLRKTVENIVDLFSGSIVIKGLTFRWQIEDSIPQILVGDPIRLGQVLSNVLSNAQKFTEQGEINLKITLRQETATFVSLLFNVSDSGIGIAAENLPLIFESFSQVDGSTTRRYGGAGLGLTITKNIIEMMDGQIKIDSKEGEGTNIQFELKFEKGKPESTFFEKENNTIFGRALKAEDFKVLVVDDDRLSRQVCREMLEKMGYHVELACNGKDALIKLESEPYSVVLMDCLMPELDGFETTRIIREKKFKDRFSCQVPIIALTAKAMDKDKQRCFESGMNDFVTKPVSFANLKKSLEKHLS